MKEFNNCEIVLKALIKISNTILKTNNKSFINNPLFLKIKSLLN